MAGKTDLGGIFFKLGLDLDKNSFESGNKQINNASESMNKLIGTARNAAVALVSIKTIGKLGTFADAESSAYKTSKALGITTESLKTWKAAAKIAGVDANSLVNSMGQLGSVLAHLPINGKGLEEYSNKLQEIGLGITDLKDKEGKWLSADKAFQKVIAKGQEEYAKANTEEEQLIVTTKMGDILGSAGQDFFIALNAMGMTIEQFRQGAGKSVWTNDKNTKDAMAFSKEWNTLSNSLSQIGAFFGANTAKELTQSLKDINEWLGTNGDSIKQSLETLAQKIGNTAGTVVNSAGAASAIFKYLTAEPGSKEQQAAYKDLEKNAEKLKTNPITARLYGLIESTNNQIIEGQKEAEQITALITERNNLKSLFKELSKNPEYVTKGKLDYSKVPKRVQTDISRYLELDGNSSMFTNVPKIKDGIIRPDGTVTQVAPDDWVIAARNLGDLARAFVPQPTTAQSGNMEFSIVQNFTINGGSDLPQVLRQQAYNGTQQGLMEIMAQSSQRLQLMSGTR